MFLKRLFFVLRSWKLLLFQIRLLLKDVLNTGSVLFKKISAVTLFFFALVQVSAQTPLFTQVLVSDVGTGNSIGSANTSRNIAVDAQGNIGVVYLGSDGLRFAKSTNRGQSFLPSVKVSNATTGDCEVEVADNGNVYVIYSNGSQISLFTSLNSGLSFSGPNVLGAGAVPHIASYGSNVYVVPKLGDIIYRNSTNGVGTFLTYPGTRYVYADIRVDKANGDVYVIQDDPRLFISKSTNSGVTFTTPTQIVGLSVNYSSYSITTGPLGKYIYVAGYNNQGYRIDFTTSMGTIIPVGNNLSIGFTNENRLVSEGRTLASDEFGNFIDGYTVNATTMAFKVSGNLGNSFKPPITIANATSHNIARNSATQDIDVVYRGTDGKIYLNVYGNLLNGLTISNVEHGYCPGTIGKVNYSMTGDAVNTSNQFIVQLSDANRSFSNPTILGTLTSSARTGSIDIVIPQNLPFGTNYRMRVVTGTPVTIGADNGFDIEFNLIPTASITPDGPTTFCQGGSVTLAANLNTAVTSYLWSNGATTPSITVSTGGDYTVTVSNFCGIKTSATTTVTVVELPVATISTSGPTAICNGNPIVLTANSNNPANTFLWSTGQTTKSISVSIPGNYSVKATNTCGISVTSASLAINLKPTPVVAFTLPDRCLEDGKAAFSNQSSVSAGGGTLSYLWDFDDKNATSQNPNTSTDKDPVHVFTAPGTYQVTLTVTATGGCSSSLSKTYTVSAALPKPEFTVLNANSLCSDQPVIFEDRATIFFGEITKIEWYFDVDGHPNDPLFSYTDNTPNLRAGNIKQYSFTYPVFHSPLLQIVNVKMRAFSGLTCMGEITKSITLKAVPDVVFSPLTNICAETGTVQFTQASELSGFAGSGIYAGPGVTASGLFDPLLAGLGQHTITYTFTGTNGCIVQRSRDITVYPTPVLDAGKDETILLDGQIHLKPIATGNKLAFKWSPATGLDKDNVENPIASPTDDITYTLTVTSADGCTAIDELFIKVLKTPEVPNTFTPNGDGINDTWTIKYLESYTTATVDIFNRFGTKVYSRSGAYNQPWDGKMNGDYLPSGTYYYIINPRNGRRTLSGQVTILK